MEATQQGHRSSASDDAVRDTNQGHILQQVSHSSTDSGTNDIDIPEEDLQNLSIAFRCPCGATDFSHCLDPPPNCLEHRHGSSDKFPNLDLRYESHRVQEFMRECLQSATEELRINFRKFKMGLRKELVKLPRVKHFICDYLDRPRESDADFDNLFDTLLDQSCDFVNFEPLKMIIEHCSPGSDHCVSALLSEYEAHFRKFSQHRVCVLPDLQLPVQQGYEELSVKIEESYNRFYLSQAHRFKNIIRKILDIPKRVHLRLKTVRQGCVELVFCIPCLSQQLKSPLSVEQKGELVAHNITMIIISGRLLYCCCDLLKDKASTQELKKLYKQNLQRLEGEEEAQHFADCIFAKEKQEDKCFLENCVYCGERVQQCVIEYHTLSCAEANKWNKSTELEVLEDKISETTVPATNEHPNKSDRLEWEKPLCDSGISSRAESEYGSQWDTDSVDLDSQSDVQDVPVEPKNIREQWKDPRPRSVKKRFVATRRSNDLLRLNLLEEDHPSRKALALPRANLLYHTVSLVHSTGMISPRSVDHFANTMRPCFTSFIQNIERSCHQEVFKLGIEARFGNVYWQLPELAHKWGPHTFKDLQDSLWHRTFNPDVDKSSVDQLIRSSHMSELEYNRTANLRFVLKGHGPDVKFEAVFTKRGDHDKYLLKAVYRDRPMDHIVRFDVAIPGRKYDIRFGDSIKPQLEENMQSTPYIVAKQIADSLQHLSEQQVSLTLRGSVNSSMWEVLFFRQKTQRLYNWRQGKKWRLAVYDVNTFDTSKYTNFDFMAVKMNAPYVIKEFNYSRQELEFWAFSVLPNTGPWITEKLMEDFDQFVEESFHISQLLK